MATKEKPGVTLDERLQEIRNMGFGLTVYKADITRALVSILPKDQRGMPRKEVIEDGDHKDDAVIEALKGKIDEVSSDMRKYGLKDNYIAEMDPEMKGIFPTYFPHPKKLKAEIGREDYPEYLADQIERGIQLTIQDESQKIVRDMASGDETKVIDYVIQDLGLNPEKMNYDLIKLRFPKFMQSWATQAKPAAKKDIRNAYKKE